MKWLKLVWTSLIFICKKLLSPILDRQWDPDPYKLCGFGLIVIAGLLALRISVLLTILETQKILAVGGIIASLITAATFLFNHARLADDTLVTKG